MSLPKYGKLGWFFDFQIQFKTNKTLVTINTNNYKTMNDPYGTPSLSLTGIESLYPYTTGKAAYFDLKPQSTDLTQGGYVRACL